jgi:hypothetical protein
LLAYFGVYGNKENKIIFYFFLVCKRAKNPEKRNYKCEEYSWYAINGERSLIIQ